MERFYNMVNSDERIGNSHMDVPGHDGKRFWWCMFSKRYSSAIVFQKILIKNFHY